MDGPHAICNIRWFKICNQPTPNVSIITISFYYKLCWNYVRSCRTRGHKSQCEYKSHSTFTLEELKSNRISSCPSLMLKAANYWSNLRTIHWFRSARHTNYETIKRGKNITLTWISSHVRIESNEIADKGVKEMISKSLFQFTINFFAICALKNEEFWVLRIFSKLLTAFPN